ncbi:MAG: hypothetical protein ACKV2T_41315 [Kofleriaceae bacterium]
MTRIALAMVALLAACDEEPLFGPPTESECPPTQTLSYENFGKPFMESYCTECHDSSLRGKDRQGAPSFHDFNTVFGIRAVWQHIDFTTAAGPTGIVNDTMPPAGEPKPTFAERTQLGEWIACEMPTDAQLMMPSQ